jgi:invasion protein IalB
VVSRLNGFVLRLVAFCAALGAASGTASAQGVVKATYADWEYRCDTTPGSSQEQCILYQNIADDRQIDLNIVLVVIRVADPAVKDAQGVPARKPVLRIIVPLGVFLPKGLSLKVDGKDIGTTPFVRCLPTGCVAEVELETSLISAFSNGKVATFFIYRQETEGHGLPFNLAGFQDGFAKLK